MTPNHIPFELGVLGTSVALIVIPISLGALLGALLRHSRGQRTGGSVAAVGFIVAPAAAIVALSEHFPIVGIWDAGLEGLLVGLGVLWAAHRAFAGVQEVLLTLGSIIASLLVLELGSRLFLPHPPSFPTGSGLHLGLADAIRASSATQGWDMRSKELVCSIAYGNEYRGILDVRGERDILTPHRFHPRQGATRRVVHIGDSMVFGMGVARSETFTAELERLEPGTQHINGGIPGIAPDAYLVVLRRWLASHDADLVVMYLFEGNDLRDLDSPFPCCDWQSLLEYGPAGATLRCPTAVKLDLGHAGWTWLRYNSPPPYLLRAIVDDSSAAAHLSAMLVAAGRDLSLGVNQPMETQFQHLEAILRSARDELGARHIPFVVTVLPATFAFGNRPGTASLTDEMAEVARRLGVSTLNPSRALIDAAAKGEQLFFERNIHFNASGHQFMARWLHERLPSDKHLADRDSSDAATVVAKPGAG